MTTKTKAWLIILGAIVFLGLLRNMTATNPPTTQLTKLTITFLGYTNDASGKQLAQFIASNNSPTTLRIAYEFAVRQNLTSGAYSIRPSINSSCVLEQHQTKSFTFPNPTNASPWNLRIVYGDWDWHQRFIARLWKTPFIHFVPHQWRPIYPLDHADSIILNP